MKAVLRFVAFGALLAVALPAAARAGSELPDVSGLAVPGDPVSASVDSRLARATGEVQLVVRLVDAPLAVAHGRDAKQRGGKLSPAQQRAYLKQLAQKQD